jgi:hypothetical protein
MALTVLVPPSQVVEAGRGAEQGGGAEAEEEVRVAASTGCEWMRRDRCQSDREALRARPMTIAMCLMQV